MHPPSLRVGEINVIIRAFENPNGADPVSTGHVEVRSRVVDPRWPRKKRGKKVIANNDYALAA